MAHTVQALWQQISSLLEDSPYVTSAPAEATWIIGHVAGRNRAELWVGADKPVEPALAISVARIARRRAAGEPLQYLLGDAYFHGLRFLCDPRALIPRPETEILVCETVRRCRGAAPSSAPDVALHRRLRIADIGAGSGCIAIALALELPTAHMTATDISSDALSLAGENASLHGVQDRIEFLEGDLLEPLTGTFDAVVFNPPYIPSGDIDSLGKEIAAEPRIALDGGPDGLLFYRRIAERWREILAPSGFLALEVGTGLMSEVIRLMKAGSFEVIKDLSGIDRVLVVREE